MPCDGGYVQSVDLVVVIDIGIKGWLSVTLSPNLISPCFRQFERKMTLPGSSPPPGLALSENIHVGKLCVSGAS